MKYPKVKLADRGSYQIRVSLKAKHVYIKVSHLGEVEVVVPKGFDQRRIPEILQRRQDWIAKTIERIEAERQLVQSEPAGVLPERILLRSLAEEWSVTHRPLDGTSVKLFVVGDRQLVLQGLLEKDMCQEALRRWLTRKAYLHLIPWLERVSQDVTLTFSKASVRGQKTRWASCSSKKSISLNYKLLFLPPHLVRYVFIHELCHTIHLNHSLNFWTLVAQKEPNYKQLDIELRKAWRYVPTWVERDEQ